MGVEGGNYISPEFQLGQVYDGSTENRDNDVIVFYRPVYICVRATLRDSVDGVVDKSIENIAEDTTYHDASTSKPTQNDVHVAKRHKHIPSTSKPGGGHGDV